MNKKFLKQIPNMITISRIILVIFSFFVIYNNNYKLGIILLIVAALTDFLDGYFARKLDASSEIGARLDQFSDKVFSLLIGLLLIILGNNYLFLTIFVEIIFLIILAIVSLKYDYWQESTKQGKIKTALIFVTIILCLTVLESKMFLIPFIVISL